MFRRHHLVSRRASGSQCRPRHRRRRRERERLLGCRAGHAARHLRQHASRAPANPTECGQTGTWFTIGSFGNPALGRVTPEDPESPSRSRRSRSMTAARTSRERVAVSCSVTEDGDGFQVELHAELTGATGGAMTITGRIDEDGRSARHDGRAHPRMARRSRTRTARQLRSDAGARRSPPVACGRRSSAPTPRTRRPSRSARARRSSGSRTAPSNAALQSVIDARRASTSRRVSSSGFALRNASR